MGHSKRLASLSGGIVIRAELLQNEEGPRTHEGVRRGLGDDDRLDVAGLGVEATKEVEHLARLGDGVADVAQLIGELFQLGEVGVDGHVALLQGAQLGLQVDGALQLVVLEDTDDGFPEGEHVVATAVDDVEDALGDRGEDPVDDAGVDHTPLAGAVLVGGDVADMALKTEFAERGVEEEEPLAEVSFVHVEDDRHMMTDGDPLDAIGVGRGDLIAIVGGVRVDGHDEGCGSSAEAVVEGRKRRRTVTGEHAVKERALRARRVRVVRRQLETLWTRASSRWRAASLDRMT